jgi:hypothetical protein
VIRRADAALRSAVDRGVDVAQAAAVPSIAALAAMRYWPSADAAGSATALAEEIERELESLT